MKIDYVNFGIANRIKDTIIINKHLKKYPEHYKEVLDHELRHTNKNFTMHDLKMDMFEGDLFKNLLFCFRHPSGFLQFSPILRYDGDWCIDINMIILYSIIFGLGWLILYGL